MARSHRVHVTRWLGAAALLSLSVAAFGCPNGKCLFRFQELDQNGEVKSDKCLVDTCPKNASFNDAKSACDCKESFVPLQGACHTMAEANTSCGKGYTYANGGCVATTCAEGQVLNAATGGCDSKKDTDAQVAASAGVDLKAGQSIGCPAGETYVISGKEGACIPNEATCGPGTKYESGACVNTGCPAGTVYDAPTGKCTKLNTGSDAAAFSVQTKLSAELGPSFCAPHAKNPAGFNVPPGGATTIKVSVVISVPGNDIEQTQLVSVHTTNVGGAELTPTIAPEVANIDKHVREQVIGDIRALGGKSMEQQASAEVTCVIKRAQIVVVTTKGGV